MENTPARQEPALAAPIVLSPAWLLFAALALAVPIGAFIVRAQAPVQEPALPVLSALPDFHLIDQSERPFARKDLLGRAWVADFVFTRCVDACPRLTATMKSVQDRLKPEEKIAVGLLSISVDPEHDTPALMHTYADAHGADLRLWHFLTGENAQIERAVVQGFKSAYAPALETGDARSQAFDIMHGEKFVLVDPDGRIRGYYDVIDPPEQERLLHDLRRLETQR